MGVLNAKLLNSTIIKHKTFESCLFRFSILFRRLYFHGAQFHTQQFASMRKLTTLHVVKGIKIKFNCLRSCVRANRVGPGVDQPVEGRGHQRIPVIVANHGEHEQEGAE